MTFSHQIRIQLKLINTKAFENNSCKKRRSCGKRIQMPELKTTSNKNAMVYYIVIVSRTTRNRSSRLQMFFKIGVFIKVSQIHRKTPVTEALFFRPATLLKMKLWHKCFPVNYTKILRAPFLKNTSGGCFTSPVAASHLRWLLHASGGCFTPPVAASHLQWLIL